MMTTHTPYRLHLSLGYQLSLAARIQERRLEDGLKPLGLTRVTWCMLLAVGHEALRQPSEIADFVGIDRTATSRALRHLEAEAIIERASGAGDGRTKSVNLTAKGRDLLERGVPLAQHNNAAMDALMTPAERDRLFALLKKLSTGRDGPLPGL